LLGLFRKNYFFNILLLLPYTCLVRLSSLLRPVVSSGDELHNPLLKYILGWVPNGLYQSLIACGLIFLQSCFIIFMFTRQRFSRENTLFSGLFYVLFVSFFPENGTLSGALIANTFFIIGVINLMKLFKITNPTIFLFNSGFFIGLAGLFYIPYFLFVFFAIIAVQSLRNFKLIETLQLFSGGLTPVFLLFAFTYLNDLAFDPIHHLLLHASLELTIPSDINWVSMLSLIVFCLCILYAILNYSTVTGKKMYQIQKKLDIIYWTIAFSALSIVLFRTSVFTPAILLAIPSAFIFSIILSESKNYLLAESVHIVFLFVVLFAQFQALWF